MILVASSAIETAPLPMLAGVAAVGAVIVIHRGAVLNWWQAALGPRVGPFAGRVFIAIGYGWLLLGLIGVFLWVFDQF